MIPCPQCGYPSSHLALMQELDQPRHYLVNYDSLPDHAFFPNQIRFFYKCQQCGKEGPRGITNTEALHHWENMARHEYMNRMYGRQRAMEMFKTSADAFGIPFDIETDHFKKKAENKMIGTCQYKDCKCQKGEPNIYDILSKAC